MLRFLILMVTQFGKTKGFSKFINKYGQKAFDKIQNKLGPNTKFSVKTIKKTVPKSKPVKKITELRRVKSQIAKNVKKPTIKKFEKSIYKIVKSKKDGMPVWVKKKIIGKSRSNFGKWKPKYED